MAAAAATGLGARSVLITGANRGIGLELVRQLLGSPGAPQWIFACSREPDGVRGQSLRFGELQALGHTSQIPYSELVPVEIVVLSDFEELRKLASSHPNLVMVKLDTTDPVTIKEAATCVEGNLKGAGLTVLINNAAVFTELKLETTGPEHMLNDYKTNVIGPLLVSQAFLPLLKKAAGESTQDGLSCRKAAIINISSVMGSVELVPLNYTKPAIPYRCSKAALNMLTKCQSLSYTGDGILCSAIHPGWVKTDMGTQEADLSVDESVRGILCVLSKLSDEHNGVLMNWKGKRIPW